MKDQTFLLIGPMKNKKNPQLTGGVIVLFEELLDYCSQNKINYNIIDTNKSNYSNVLVAFLVILIKIIYKTPKVSHVSLHGTANDYLYIAPFALITSKIFRKPFSLRKFAGNFDDLFKHYSNIKKKTIIFILKNSSYVFFETKYLVRYFKEFNNNTYWFPNVRKKQYVYTDEKYQKKFIFLGTVSREKGIDILCQAANLLSNEYQIDIYGPLHDEYTNNYFDDYHVNYKGILQAENVIETLRNYNVLLLPSFREGYPGVIIEAFSVGLPVIATKLQGISEMVSNNSGQLINVGSIDELTEAIQSMTQKKYEESKISVLNDFQNFESNKQTMKFFTYIS